MKEEAKQLDAIVSSKEYKTAIEEAKAGGHDISWVLDKIEDLIIGLDDSMESDAIILDVLCDTIYEEVKQTVKRQWIRRNK